MSMSTKIIERLSFREVCCKPLFSYAYKGVPKLGIIHLKQPHHWHSAGVCAKAVQCWASYNSTSDSEKGVVLPASCEFAEEAIQSIRSGKVIAVPTDTIYGFACDACSGEAVKKIYEIKGRKLTSPLAICVGDALDIRCFAVINYLPDTLLDILLPGPVTVVLRRGEFSVLVNSLNPGLESIGVRVPDNDFIRTITRGSGSALALTSANLSGHPSSVSTKDFEHLWEHCAYIFDGGHLPMGRAGSTIVDLTNPGKYRIIRPGSAWEYTVAILQRHSLQEERTDNL